MMHEKTMRRAPFDWRLPLSGAAGALILFAPIIVYGALDLDVAYIVIAGPIVSLAAIVVALFKKFRLLAVLAMLAAYWLVSMGLFLNSRDLHWTARWLLWSKQYKSELRRQPESANGEFRHIEWDGWGIAGMETIVYLVFDPKDAPAMTDGKTSGGIPCHAVAGVHRLETNYYAVIFYTNDDWSHCS